MYSVHPKINMRKLFLISIVLTVFYSCEKDESPIIGCMDVLATNYNPDAVIATCNCEYFLATPYIIETPFGFPEMEFEENNPLTEEGVSLGEELYFDNILSTNGLSCNSCHKKEYSYSLPINGPTGNNIMPHFNLGWKKHFGWTGGEEILELVDLGDLEDGNPFLNHSGMMGQNDSILARLKRHPEYKSKFQKAFNIDIVEISETNRKQYISNALAQFMRTLITADSKYDRYIKGEEQLTPSELNGYAIFNSEKGDCFHCHGTAMFTDQSFHNNGLNANHSGNNQGRYLVTNQVEDIGKFYSPSLRNIEFTSPYMHDGRFTSLEEVVEHYNSGGIYSSTIDPNMKKVGIGLQLTEQEKADLVAYLKSLSDHNFISK